MRGKIEAMKMRTRAKMHPRQLHMMLRNPSARSFKYQEGWQYLKNKMNRGEDKNGQQRESEELKRELIKIEDG